MAKKRPSLGKGLHALLGDTVELDTSTDLHAVVQDTTGQSTTDGSHAAANHPLTELALSTMVPLNNQPRKHFDEESLEQLALSIKEQGVLQPIIVRQTAADTYQIIVGERRWRAAQKAGLEVIPALIRDFDQQTIPIIALLENIQRQDLNPVEVSEALSHLNSEHKLTHSDIATALGMSRPAVSNLLRLAELPPSIKNMLTGDSLDMGHARAILAVADADRLSLAQYIIDHKLTVRQTESLAKKWPLNTEKIQAHDLDIQSFAQQCSEALSAKVTIQHKVNGSGTFTMRYTSLEQLHHLTGKMDPQLAMNNTQVQEITDDAS